MLSTFCISDLLFSMQLDTQLQKAQSQAEQNQKEQHSLQQKIQQSTAGKENSVSNLSLLGQTVANDSV